MRDSLNYSATKLVAFFNSTGVSHKFNVSVAETITPCLNLEASD